MATHEPDTLEDLLTSIAPLSEALEDESVEHITLLSSGRWMTRAGQERVRRRSEPLPRSRMRELVERVRAGEEMGAEARWRIELLEGAKGPVLTAYRRPRADPPGDEDIQELLRRELGRGRNGALLGPPGAGVLEVLCWIGSHLLPEQIALITARAPTTRLGSRVLSLYPPRQPDELERLARFTRRCEVVLWDEVRDARELDAALGPPGASHRWFGMRALEPRPGLRALAHRLEARPAEALDLIAWVEGGQITHLMQRVAQGWREHVAETEELAQWLDAHLTSSASHPPPARPEPPSERADRQAEFRATIEGQEIRRALEEGSEPEDIVDERLLEQTPTSLRGLPELTPRPEAPHQQAASTLDELFEDSESLEESSAATKVHEHDTRENPEAQALAALSTSGASPEEVMTDPVVRPDPALRKRAEELMGAEPEPTPSTREFFAEAASEAEIDAILEESHAVTASVDEELDELLREGGNDEDDIWSTTQEYAQRQDEDDDHEPELASAPETSAPETSAPETSAPETSAPEHDTEPEPEPFAPEDPEALDEELLGEETYTDLSLEIERDRQDPSFEELKRIEERLLGHEDSEHDAPTGVHQDAITSNVSGDQIGQVLAQFDDFSFESELERSLDNAEPDQPTAPAASPPAPPELLTPPERGEPTQLTSVPDEPDEPEPVPEDGPGNLSWGEDEETVQRAERPRARRPQSAPAPAQKSAPAPAQEPPHDASEAPSSSTSSKLTALSQRLRALRQRRQRLSGEHDAVTPGEPPPSTQRDEDDGEDEGPQNLLEALRRQRED